MSVVSHLMHQTVSDVPEAVIAVMGPTGSGKSTFINLISKSNLDIGSGLASCTSVVKPGDPFILDGRRVVLVDTPGFDDTTRSDIDVLNTIALFLAASYERGIKLAGVLYFHRISDKRVGGTQVKNFKMFRKFCGDNALKNVVIVTNMWGEVKPHVGEAREAELMGKGLFFEPALKKGAQMARHKNTVSSAKNIIRLILNRDPLPLHIQRELVDEGKDISQTRAGQELNRELADQIRKHKEEDIRVLREEMQQAIDDRDEETRREKEAETGRMQEEIEKLENDARRFASDYQRKKQELETRLAEVDGEIKREVDRVAARYQEQINELDATTEAEKAQLRHQMGELSTLAAGGFLLAFAVSTVAVGPALGVAAPALAVAAPALKLKVAMSMLKLKTIVPVLGRLLGSAIGI